MKATPKPNDLNSVIEKFVATQHEPDELKRRDLFVELMGKNGLNLIDETKHKQSKRFLP